MKKTIRTLFYSTLLSVLTLTATAQDQNTRYFTPVTPPSPTIASLGKYGNLPVQLSTGTATADIPLYTLKLKDNYKIDFGLHYSTNGVRIDDMAGNVGTDWSFIGEFAIKRVVFDDPDERSRDYSTLLDGGFNTDSLSKLVRYGPGAYQDVQPDLFTLIVPGFSAKFYLSGDSGVFLNRNTSYKIAWQPGFGFKVTDGRGNVLMYGGDAIEKTRMQAACPAEKEYYPTADYHTTAWFLKSIVTPYKDEITFHYSDLNYTYTGNVNITSVLEQRPISQSSNCECGIMDKQHCTTQMIIQSKKLDYLLTSNHCKILFDYTYRKDNLSDRVLQAMGVYSTFGGKQTLLRNIRLDYNYGKSKKRPFLSKVVLLSAGAKDSMAYAMSYNKIDDLPDRLNVQTDYWGYYNANANDGKVNPGVSGYGTLSRITYPTGGYDDIHYESNILRTLVTDISWNGSALLNGYGEDDHRCKEYKQIVTLYRSKNTIMQWSGQAEWKFPQPPDVNMHQMFVSIKDIGTGKQYVSKRVQAGEQLTSEQSSIAYGNRDSVKLEIVMSTCGQYVYGTFYVHWGEVVESYQDLPFAGVRTAKVVSVGYNGQQQVKRYYYHAMGRPGSSSGMATAHAEFIEELYTRRACYSNGQDGPVFAGTSFCYYKLKHNKSLVDLFAYSSAPMYYTHVIEGNGENFENGAIEHEFDIRLPGTPSTIWTANTGSFTGNGFYAAPFSILRESVAEEKRKTWFKQSTGGLKKIRKEEYEYQWPATSHKSRKGYTFRQRFFNEGYKPASTYYTMYDVNSYYYLSSWFGKSKVTDSTFADDGGVIVNQQSYAYDQVPFNNNISAIEEIASKGHTIRTTYQYATHRKGQAVYDTMVRHNRVDEVVASARSGNGVTGSEMITYGFTGGDNSIIAPSLVQTQKTGWPVEDRYRFYRYDNKGNILERSKTADAREVYLWGYNHQYPVARITGSDYATVSAMVDPSVQAILDQPSSDEQLRTTLDKLRTKLASQALVTTYTYQPLVGMTSETDLAGQTTYYEYDGFGRLKLIRDQHSKVLKLFCYNYAGQREDCGGMVFYNTPKSQVFTRNNCPAGRYGGQVTYSVPARKYSAGTQPAADAMAQADINANGQNYANQHGSCLYGNTAKSQVFTRNNCPVGGTGAKVTYTVPAGKYKATTQEAANVLAQNDINANGQGYANQHGTCTFRNASRSQTFTKNNCTAPYRGSQVTYLVQEGKYTSVISLENVNQKAQNDINANGQNYANTRGSCVIVYAKISYQNIINKPNIERRADVYVSFFSDINCTIPFAVTNLRVNYKVESIRCGDEAGSTKDYSAVCNGTTSLVAQNAQLYWNGGDYYHCWQYEYAVTMGTGYLPCGFAYRNALISKTFTRNNCGTGYLPGSATYTVAAGKHTSPLSQEAADALAQADMNANGQNYANVHAPCHKIYYNEEKKQTFIRNNCPSGHKPGSITYIVAAKKYTSLINQDDANAKAQQDINTNGQAYANSHASCTPSPVFHSREDYGDFTRNNCGAGYIGTIVRYIVPEGKHTSTIDQEDANRKARADVNANGQNYANANGTCNKLVIYAKIAYENLKWVGDIRQTADVYIKFYSDAGCTRPYAVSNLTVKYKKYQERCNGMSPGETNYSKVCNGTATLVLQGVDLYWNGGDQNHCWLYSYAVAPGSGYTNK